MTMERLMTFVQEENIRRENRVPLSSCFRKKEMRSIWYLFPTLFLYKSHFKLPQTNDGQMWLAKKKKSTKSCLGKSQINHICFSLSRFVPVLWDFSSRKMPFWTILDRKMSSECEIWHHLISLFVSFFLFVQRTFFFCVPHQARFSTP